jgi:hypothetical protein
MARKSGWADGDVLALQVRRTGLGVIVIARTVASSSFGWEFLGHVT